MSARSEDERIVIAVNALGLGQRPSAWQSEHLDAHAILDADHWIEVARVAERGTLDAVFLADSPGFSDDPLLRPQGLLEPTALFATVAAATDRVGLIATASTTFNDPYELARRLLTLDHLSGGRFGWNIVTTQSGPIARNFGVDDVPDRTTRYERAYEFTQLVEALWAGDEVGHHGSQFSFQGRLALPPSPQGHPVLVQAGGSPGGRRLAGEKAEGVFTAEMTVALARRHYREVKDLAIGAGRDPRSVTVLPGFALVIGSTEAEAARRYDELEARGPAGYTLKRLSGILGVDVSDYDLDAPLPAALVDGSDGSLDTATSLSFRETTIGFAVENGLTVRQLLREYGGYGHPIIVGTPERIADTLEDWFTTGAADGFTVMPDVFPEGLATFVDEVVPLLRARGLFRQEYGAATLRGRLAEASGRRAVVSA